MGFVLRNEKEDFFFTRAALPGEPAEVSACWWLLLVEIDAEFVRFRFVESASMETLRVVGDVSILRYEDDALVADSFGVGSSLEDFLFDTHDRNELTGFFRENAPGLALAVGECLLLFVEDLSAVAVVRESSEVLSNFRSMRSSSFWLSPGLDLADESGLVSMLGADVEVTSDFSTGDELLKDNIDQIC